MCYRRLRTCVIEAFPWYLAWSQSGSLWRTLISYCILQLEHGWIYPLMFYLSQMYICTLYPPYYCSVVPLSCTAIIALLHMAATNFRYNLIPLYFTWLLVSLVALAFWTCLYNMSFHFLSVYCGSIYVKFGMPISFCCLGHSKHEKTYHGCIVMNKNCMVTNSQESTFTWMQCLVS